ncbi:MAG: hypothetical protein GWN86_20065, partial [Desulfobacterales bacterium]|nr:hypothetical protein [Desulfobacterales bacterium]
MIPAETLTYNLRAPPRMRLYDSYRAQGYFDWAWRQESGDWKTWPINVTDPSTVAAFVTCNWTGRMTDIDMFGINPHETLIDGAPSPHLGNGRFQWRTRTGTTAEYLVLDTSLDSQPLPGVYKALLHNVLLDGTVFPEELRGRVQLVKLLPRGSVKKPIDLKLRPGEAAYAPLTLTTGKRLTNLTVTGWRSPISIVPITLDEIEAHSPLKFNLSAVAPIDTPEGIYPLTATITSTEIPFQIEISLNVTVDNTPPEASISLPEPGAHIRGTYEVEVTGDDPHLDRMELYLDHTLLRTWDTAGTQNFNLATPEYADGDYRIRILVYDETGNQAEDSVRVTIDNTPPEASILSPPDRTHLRKPHNITAYAFDSHLEKAELYLNDTLLTTWNTSRVQTRLLNTQDYIDGTYLIRLKVTDKAGDQTQDQVTIVIDNTPPTAHLIAPIEDIHLAEMYNITFTFQDDNLRNATLLLDRKPLSDIQDRNSYLWNTTEVLDGEHILTLAIIDEAGNSRTLERRVTVDNTLPTAEIREPSPNTHLEGSHPVVIHGHDTNLRLIELYLNQTRLSTWEQGGTKNYTWDT